MDQEIIPDDQFKEDPIGNYIQNQWDQGGEKIHRAIAGIKDQNYQPLGDLGVEQAMSTLGSFKMPLKNGLEVRVETNPTPTQAKNIFNRSKADGIRYFADPKGNLHMWDSYDLTHEDVMNHLGIPYDHENYQGAGYARSPEEAMAIAKKFLKPKVPKKMAEGGFVPDDQFQPDPSPVSPPTQAPSSASFVSDQDFVPDEEKYGTPGQLAISALEGGAQGLMGPLVPAAEKAMGVNPQDILNRQSTNPLTHYGSEALGFVAPAIASLGASGLARLGVAGAAEALPAIANASKFTQAGVISSLVGNPELVSQLGNVAVRSAFEGALATGSDELSQLFLNDPNQTASLAAAHIGLGTILAGVSGPILEGLASKFKPKMISELDQSNFANGDFKTSVANSDLINDADKPGILEGLSKEKPNADEIRAASQELGITPLEGMVSDHPLIQKAEDTLLNSAPTYSGIARQKAYNEVYDAAKGAVDQAIGEGSPYSKAELGNLMKESITSQISEENQPISQLYNEIKQYHEAIPLSEKSAPAIARNIENLQELRLSPSSPEGKLASRVMNEIENLKTVDDVKAYKSILNRSISPTASSGEKRMVGILNDKLTDLEENSIVRFAENNMQTPQAKQRVLDLISQRDQADSLYKAQMQKVGTLSEQLGKGRVYGPKDAINFIQDRLTPEEIVQKLFSKNNSEFLDFFSKNYPEQMQLMRDYQKGILRDQATKTGEFTPKTVLKQVDKLEPEIKKVLFSPEELKKLEASQTILQSIPKSFNPSGTAHELAFREFFSSPIKAATSNVTDLALSKFIKRFGADPEIKAATRMAEATLKGEKAASKGIESIFEGTSSPIEKPSEKETHHLEKTIEKINEDPSKLMDIANHAPGIPEYSALFGNLASRAIQYLNTLKPKTDPTSPLDSDRVPPQSEEAAYKRALQFSQNPLLVLNEIKDGSLTSQDVATLKAVHPDLYKRLSQKLVAGVIANKEKGKSLPYSSRMTASLFLGQPLDSTMTPQAIQLNQAHLQVNQAQNDAKNQMPASSGRQQGSMKNLGKMNALYATPDQAREANRQLPK